MANAKKTKKKDELKCGCCGEVIEDEPATEHEGKPICESCVENEEPDATVYFGDDKEPHFVYRYREDCTDFTCKWHATDAWRGYMDVTSEKWMLAHTDCILSGSADANELKAMDEMLRHYCDEQGIRYARVFTNTSNCCSQGYDFFVLREQMDDFLKLAQMMATVSKLAGKFRDDDRFQMTAITGKSEFDENDKKLLKAKKLLDDGMSFEDVMEQIMGVAADVIQRT